MAAPAPHAPPALVPHSVPGSELWARVGSRGEARRRIEHILVLILRQIAAGQVPTLALTDGVTLLALAGWRSGSPVRLARAVKMLRLLHERLEHDDVSTLTDLKYTLRPCGPFASLEAATERTAIALAIEDVCDLVCATRGDLNIEAKGVAIVSGAVTLTNTTTTPVTVFNVSDLPGGCFNIGGDADAYRDGRWTFATEAEVMLITEHDATRSYLANAARTTTEFGAAAPILFTPSGHFDSTALHFVSELLRQNPRVKAYVLGDYNVWGANIWAVAKHGPARGMGCGAKLPSLRWLGVHHEWMAGLRTTALTQRDVTVGQNLAARLRGLGDARWAAEVEGMWRSGKQAQVQAAYTRGGARALLARLGQMVAEGKYL